ncbi:MAG: response regulator [Planctomycetota bacterium]|nr:response regulator [Planctomycetota bacterium]
MDKRTFTILLIEDDPVCAEVVRQSLSSALAGDFGLEVTDRLSDGLGRLEEGNIDLILLDLGLPDSDGLETLWRIHSRTKLVPIIILTGTEDEMVGIRAVQAVRNVIRPDTEAASVSLSCRK